MGRKPNSKAVDCPNGRHCQKRNDEAAGNQFEVLVAGEPFHFRGISDGTQANKSPVRSLINILEQTLQLILSVHIVTPPNPSACATEARTGILRIG